MPTENIDFPTSSVASLMSGPVTVRQAIVGKISIDRVTLNDLNGVFNYKSGIMKNAQIKLVISPFIDYWWGACIDLGWFGTYCVGDNGSIPLGTIDTGFVGLGDVSIAGGQLVLDVAKTTFGPLVMTPDPIGGGQQEITTSSIRATEISMQDAKISTGLPAIGLNLPLPNPMGSESANIRRTEIGQSSLDDISVPPLTLKKIDAQNIRIDQATSGGFEATGSITKSTPWVNLAFVGFRLRLDITTTLSADEIIMNGLSGEVKVDTASASGFAMPLSLEGINIEDVQVNGINFPTIVVGV